MISLNPFASTVLTRLVGDRWARLAWLFSFWSLAFVMISWMISGGVPYYKDGNETFLSFAHAKNLLLYGGREFSFLTLEGTEISGISFPEYLDVYTHNPNQPRYWHMILLAMGVHDLTTHVLLICSIASVIAAVLTVRSLQAMSFPFMAAAMIVLFLSLDLFGYMQYITNTFRVFSFLLFWACVWAVVKDARWFMFAPPFMLSFQHEFGFAVFTFVTSCAIAVVVRGRLSVKPIEKAILFSGLSALVFIAQLVSYYGWEGLILDLQFTSFLRNAPEGIDLNSLRPALLAERQVLAASVTSAQSIDSILREWWSYTGIYYGGLLPVLIVAALLILLGSLIVNVRLEMGWQDLVRVGLPALAAWCGAAVVAQVIPGYFVAAYIQTYLPLLVFPVTLTLGAFAWIMWSGLRHILAGGPLPGRDLPLLVGHSTTVLLGGILVLASVRTVSTYSLMGPEVVTVLRDLRGAPTAAAVNFHQYAFALGGIATYASPPMPGDEFIQGLPIGTRYVCIERAWMGTRCSDVEASLNERGYPTLQRRGNIVVVALGQPG